MQVEIVRLAGVVGAFNVDWKRPGRSKAEALALVRDELEALAAQARDEDPEMIPVVVSLIHLLADFRDGAVPEDLGEQLFQLLEENLSRNWLPPDWSDWLARWVLHGEPVAAHPGPAGPLGCTLIRWGAFCDYYAAAYGKAKFSPHDQQRLWERLEQGRLQMTQRELHLDGTHGVVWFTDEGELRRVCASPQDGRERIDGNRAYDRLGLDWSQRWERIDPEGEGASRAVLLSVPVESRSRAAGGLFAPTALDGWGNLAFVPGDPQRGGAWPSVGSFTVDPVSGERGFPEAVHGRLDVAEGETCPVEGCGEVSKALADRIAECGPDVVARALRRL